VRSTFAALLLLLSLLLVPSHAFGAVVLVDHSDAVSDGASPYVCGSAANKCATIQHGVDHAAVGDTVSVAPGSYTTETVTVNKSLTLRGPQSQVDARSRPIVDANEAEVTGPAGKTAFNITANAVTIDGFLVQGNTDSNTYGFGILSGAATSGLRIENTIVRNNVAGLSLGADHSVLSHNLFTDNNNVGPVSGTAIYTDQFNAGGPLDDVRIEDNDFKNNQNAGMLFGATSGDDDDIVISGNRSLGGDGNAMLIFSATNVTIAGNVFGPTAASALVLGGNVSGATISGNTFTASPTRGMRIGDFGGGGPNSQISILGNAILGRSPGITLETPFTGTPTLRGNRFAGNAPAGLTTALPGVSATDNWWGCNGGPGAPGCDIVDGTAAASAVTAPHTVMSLSASPGVIPALGGASRAVADLAHGSDGSPIALGVPDGTPVAFSTTRGAIQSPGTTQAGLAGATLTSDAAFGATTLTATLDNQSVTTALTIRPGDSDGDGRTDDVDCAPADPTKPAHGPVADANCDGVADKLPTPDTARPRLALGLASSRFKASRGIGLRATLSEPAALTVTLRRRLAGRRSGTKCVAPTRSNRKARACTRTRSVRSLTVTGLAKGLNRRTVPATDAHKKRLTSGAYEASAIARDAAGNRSIARTVRFTILKP
jgi:nitrous oxidase accessory protein NosD